MIGLIGVSIGLQVVCVIVAVLLAVRARNGSWRFWAALAVAFVGIVLRRTLWLIGSAGAVERRMVLVGSIGATYLISCAFLAAMFEAWAFHRRMRQRVETQTDNIRQLEQRLEERDSDRAA